MGKNNQDSEQVEMETYTSESGLESKTFDSSEIGNEALQQQVNAAQEKKKKSSLSIVGKVILYFLLLPFITSFVYYHRAADSVGDPLTNDIPRIAKVIAVILWILIILYLLVGRWIFK